MSSATTTYKVDDEIKPTVEALQQETAHLLELAKEIYVPSNVADTVIGEVLPVHQQLLLYVVSAHVALSSMFCQRKLANEPIPEKLTQQILRVQGYLKKLKEHGIDINAANAALPAAATTAGSAASRRNLDARGQGNRRGGAGAPGSGGAHQESVSTNEQEALLLATSSSSAKLTGNRRERDHNEEVGKKTDEQQDDGYLRFSEDTEKREEEKRRKKIDPLVAQRVGQLATQGAKRRDI